MIDKNEDERQPAEKIDPQITIFFDDLTHGSAMVRLLELLKGSLVSAVRHLNPIEAHWFQKDISAVPIRGPQKG